VHAGEDERLTDPVAVDQGRGLVGVLLDDREQVREQQPLAGRQLDVVDLAAGLGMLELVDGRTRYQPGLAGMALRGRARAAAAPGAFSRRSVPYWRSRRRGPVGA